MWERNIEEYEQAALAVRLVVLTAFLFLKPSATKRPGNAG